MHREDENLCVGTTHPDLPRRLDAVEERQRVVKYCDIGYCVDG